MTGRPLVLIGLALMVAPPLFADKAVPRDGGSSGSSDSGSRHHGSASSSSSSSSSGSSSNDSSSSSQSSSSVPSARTREALRRHPQPGTGTGTGGYGDRGGYGYGRGGYDRGGYYGGYYNRGYYPSYYGYDYWYSPYYYSGYYGYSPQYYRTRSRESGALRLQVQPEKTRVYVDGYYAGIADDFDGLLQRLYLPPGRHDVTLKLEGFRSHTFKVYVPIDGTIKVHHDMIEGAGEETVDVVGNPQDYARREGDRVADRGDDREYDRAPRERRDRGRAEDGVDRDDAGSLRLRVRPADASVYVDGKFHGAARDLESLSLAPGRHRVEVVRPGFRTVEREVEVDRGRAAELEVELEKN